MSAGRGRSTGGRPGRTRLAGAPRSSGHRGAAVGVRGGVVLLLLALGTGPGPAPGAAQEGGGRPAAVPAESPGASGSDGALVVRVTDDEGDPVHGARVTAAPVPTRRPGGGTASGRGVDSGREAGPADGDAPDPVLLREGGVGDYGPVPLLPGRWRVRAEKIGYRPSTDTVRIRTGERAVLRLSLPRDPVPLAEIRARAEPPQGVGEPGRTVDHVRFAAGSSGPVSVGDWLAGLAGVEVRRRGSGGREVVSVRGSRPEGVRVLLDGVPLNDPVTGVADLSRIPVGSLESATLVRGASAAAGSGGLAAVLVLRSAAGVEEGAWAAIEVGSFGERAADVRASVSGRPGSLTVTGRVERDRNDYPFRNRVAPGHPTEERRNADVRARHASLTADSRGGTVRLRARFDDVERGTPGRMGSRIFDRARWEERSVQASLGVDATDGLEVVGAVQGFGTGYTDPRRGVQDERRGGTARLRARLRTEAGWEVSGRLTREWVAGDGIRDPGRLQGGGRLARTVGGDPVRLRAVLAADVSSAGVVWSPEAAVEARPGSGFRLWGRAGRGFRLPALADLYLTPAYGVAPTPDLRPERVTLDLETGAEWAGLGEGLRLRAVAFRRTATDPILWLAESAALWRPRNADGLVARGVETGVRWRPGRRLTLRAGLTAQRSRVRVGAGESPLPYAANLEAEAAATWRWGTGSLRAEWHMTGSRPTRLAGSRRLPAFALLDVTVRHAFRMGDLPVEAELDVRNLLDVRYELVELFPEPGRTAELRLRFGPFPPSGDP